MGIMKLKNGIAIIVLIIVGSALLALFSSPVWMGWLLRHSQNETYEAIRNVSLPCLPGTEQKTEAWSKAGFSVSCRKGETIHGPWQAWEGGHLAIKGEFFEGQKSGTWLVYANNGSLYRTITYEGGTEISAVKHEKK
jgi:hypothetical protein